MPSTITHPGPLHMIVLYQRCRSAGCECEFGSFLANCLKMVQSTFSYVTSTFPQRGLFVSFHFYLPLICFLSSCTLDMGPGLDLLLSLCHLCHLSMYQNITCCPLLFLINTFPFFCTPVLSLCITSMCLAEPYHHPLTSATVHPDQLICCAPPAV